jgi:hypothetical protein
MPYAAAQLNASAAAIDVQQLKYQPTVDGSADLPPQGRLAQLNGALANMAGAPLPAVVNVQLFADQARTVPLTPVIPANVEPSQDATKGGMLVASLEVWYDGPVWAAVQLDNGTAGVTLCGWWDRQN